MYWFYYNQELVACYEQFSELADFFVVECLGVDKNNRYSYELAITIFTEWFFNADRIWPRASLIPWKDGVFEFYYG